MPRRQRHTPTRARRPRPRQDSGNRVLLTKLGLLRQGQYFRVFGVGATKAAVVFALLSLSLSATYASAPATFSNSDINNILALGGAMNGAILLTVLICVRRAWLVNALLSITSMLGLASAYAIHTDLYLAQPSLMWTLLAAAGFTLFVVFGVIDRSPRVGLMVLGSISLATSLFAANQFRTGAKAVVVSGDTSNIRDLVFHRRPNLYFVSFDGIAPRVLLQKYMGLETTQFHDLFETRFRPFKNFFSDAFSTRYSLGTLLALDMRTFWSMWLAVRAETGQTEWDPLLFSGQSPSPLFRLLKNNGYEVATAYEDEFFGKSKGAFVDYYFTGGRRVVCGLLDGRIRAVSFFGHCLWQGSDVHEARRRVIDRIGEASFRNGPQFAMAHLYTPGHVARSFRYNDNSQLEQFRDAYQRGSAEAARLLSRLLAHLDENDPQAILLVYSDHGPFLSNGMAFADAPNFVVQDHHGILGGVWPPTVCESEFDATYARQGFLTLLDAVHAVLRCLSGGQSVLRVATGTRVIGNWHGVVPGGNTIPFKRFLYE